MRSCDRMVSVSHRRLHGQGSLPDFRQTCPSRSGQCATCGKGRYSKQGDTWACSARCRKGSGLRRMPKGRVNGRFIWGADTLRGVCDGPPLVHEGSGGCHGNRVATRRRKSAKGGLRFGLPKAETGPSSPASKTEYGQAAVVSGARGRKNRRKGARSSRSGR